MLSYKDLGERISQVRQLRFYSQEQLSKKLQMSRSTYTQIELGNRKVTAIELQTICNLLEISIEKLMSDNYKANNIEIASKEEEKEEIRVSVPNFNKEKFVEILLYLINKCGSQPNFGKTVLVKLLYFSDFDFYEIYEEHLTGATYTKMPYGPLPENIYEILKAMEESGLIAQIQDSSGKYEQTRFIAQKEPNLKKLFAHEKEVIDKVIAKYSEMTAKSLSELSHKDMPWLASEDGEVIDYELAFYREAPFSARNYKEEEE